MQAASSEEIKMLLSLRGRRRPRPPQAETPPDPLPPPPPRIGLALGGGAARGWAHIGVLHELAAHGIVPDVVAGTSIGAVIGACLAAGKLDRLEAFARRLNRRRMLQLMDLSLGGTSLIGGARLRRRLERDLGGVTIEALKMSFAAVATELGTGREVCLARGDLVQAIRASYAIPGIFQPVKLDGRWLFDGAMSNPVPVSVARALGADIVIAVNLTSDLGGPIGTPQVDTTQDASLVELDDLADTIVGEEAEIAGAPRRRRLAYLRRRLFSRRQKGAPGIARVMVGAFWIAQERISRSRLAIDPPDITINARLTSVGIFDFHRAAELIDHGRLVTRRALPRIEAKLGRPLGAERPAAQLTFARVVESAD